MKKLMMIATLAASLLPATAASAWPGRPSDPPTAGDPPPPEPGWRHDAHGDRFDRGDRYERPDRYDRRDDRRYEERWMTLSSFTPARQGRTTVRLAGRDRHIDRLRIEAVRGTPMVKQVILEYANGDHERLPVDMTLQPGQNHVISLNGDRRVQRITVYTEPRSGGAFSLSASS